MAIQAQETPVSITQEPVDLSKCVLITANKPLTPQVLLKDLEAGRTRSDIQARYAYTDAATGELKPLEKWMVDRMFEDPILRGKKPAKIKRLPFEFFATTVEPTADTATATAEAVTSEEDQVFEDNSDFPERDALEPMILDDDIDDDIIDLG